MSDLAEILKKLVRLPSITPKDAGCQTMMLELLAKLGFVNYCFDNPPVANFFSRYGINRPLLVFAGHTDVVPVGDSSKWKTNPFELTEINGIGYGRGVADMKGSLAAMLVAAQRFIEQYPNFVGSLGFLITSGEEGDDFNYGTPYVMEELEKQGIKIDYCIVGEPSSSTKVGDVIRIGRRGSLTGELTLQGKQGHVAYPHLAENPIHRLSPALAELASTCWDQGNAHFPATSFQITHILAGGKAGNIIPGELALNFNFRFSTEQTYDSLKKQVLACFERHDLKPFIHWRQNGEPFLTAKGKLLDSCIKGITLLTQASPTLSTGGGTSDGRFIAPYGVEVIELGPVNASIHQVNEWVAMEDLEVLSAIYFEICRGIFDLV